MTLAPPLLERDKPLAVLSALLTRASQGAGHVALVSGEAGIGKTALLRQLVSERARPPVRVLWGGCDALFTPRPLAPLQEVGWHVGGDLAEVLREGVSRDAIFRTLLQHLRHPQPPALVVLEDVHWADEATLDLLKFLGRRAATTSALFVFTWREEDVPRNHALRSVLADLPADATSRVRLEPLSPSAVQRLAAEARRSAEGLHEATGGNPFFVTEILAQGPDGAVPTTVRDAVLGRVSRLSARAQALLDVACVVPASIELSLLAAIAGEAYGGLDEVAAAGVLAVSGDAGSFRHELARRALEDGLSPLRSRELHARVLAWLHALPDDPARLPRLAHHAVRAGDGPAVVDFCSRAAQRADRLGAHREAEAHLRSALEYASSIELRRRAELLDARVAQCFLIDRMPDGATAGAEALAIWEDLDDRERQAGTLRELARTSWYMADAGLARRFAARATAVLEGMPASSLHALSWSTRALLEPKPRDQRLMAERAVALARASGDAEALSNSLDTLGCAAVQAGDARGWGYLEESIRVARDHGVDAEAARAYSNIAALAVEEGRFDEAEQWVADGVAFADERDLGTQCLCSIVYRSRLRVLQGRWAEATTDVERIMAHPLASVVTRMVSDTSLGLMRARRGDPGAWEALDAAHVSALKAGDAEAIVPLAAARAELAWLEGDEDRARSEITAAIPIAVTSERGAYLGPLAVWAKRLALGLEMPSSVSLSSPYAEHLAGDWQAASAGYCQRGCVYESALARYDGDDQLALKEAVRDLDQLDARPAARRLRARLASLGARRIPRGPNAPRKAHPFDLTPREEDVLRALAMGLSNAQIGKRLFVSAKTVDHHVSSILAKLEAPSRGAAVAEARKHGLLEEDST
jgi:DNA-binding CsgD family transcriptional regulator